MKVATPLGVLGAAYHSFSDSILKEAEIHS